jgi:hypothetical protein
MPRVPGYLPQAGCRWNQNCIVSINAFKYNFDRDFIKLSSIAPIAKNIWQEIC